MSIKGLFSIPLELFGCSEGFDEDKVKRNISLYRQYAVGSIPNYWLKDDVMDEWNALICGFCNELPEGATAFSRKQSRKLRLNYYRLLIKDSLPTSKHHLNSKNDSKGNYDEGKKPTFDEMISREKAALRANSIEIAALRANVDVEDLREISYVAGGHRWEYEYGYDDWEYYDLIDDYLNDRER